MNSLQFSTKVSLMCFASSMLKSKLKVDVFVLLVVCLRSFSECWLVMVVVGRWLVVIVELSFLIFLSFFADKVVFHPVYFQVESF